MRNWNWSLHTRNKNHLYGTTNKNGSSWESWQPKTITWENEGEILGVFA